MSIKRIEQLSNDLDDLTRHYRKLEDQELDLEYNHSKHRRPAEARKLEIQKKHCIESINLVGKEIWNLTALEELEA